MQHGGNLNEYAKACGCSPVDILDCSANINPLGFPEWTRPLLARCLDQIVHYPDPDSREFVAAVAEHLGVASESVVAGNGSSEIMRQLPLALSAGMAVVPAPAYSDYEHSARLAGLEVQSPLLLEENDFSVDWNLLDSLVAPKSMVYLGQPNNPTGQMFDVDAFAEFAKARAHSFFVVDESFADFVEGYESVALRCSQLSNVVVLRSMTKFYAVPGLRVGFAVAAPEVAARLRKLLAPWSVNVFAQAFGARALCDDEYARETRRKTIAWRSDLHEKLSELGRFKIYCGHANFLLTRLIDKKTSADEVARRLLLDHRVAVRVCDNFRGLNNGFLRFAVRTPAENDRLCTGLASVLGCRPSPVKTARGSVKRRTPAIMFQGTSSNAGKSVLAAGLCRMLLQDGVHVAPFKAQNMSLNSFVTADGGEMGRAQVVQAQACRVAPDVRMNPILLKPNSDTGAQVVLRGRPAGNMNVLDYCEYKKEAVRQVHDCYDSLASEHDAIVIEGAGSPGEVNLKKNDIVNMSMARYAQAPVLLVGDIDRGGVYAAFVGVMEVLAEWERELVAGFVVNRFRGDQRLLKEAHEYVYAHTGREVFGVLPYIHDLSLPEEDSVEFKSGRVKKTVKTGETVDVAVVDLPHISNFTDMDPLELEPDVNVRIVRDVRSLGCPDALIIPGSKNTIADLNCIRESGLADAVLELAGLGKTEVIGVCGGFQMLGRKILDSLRVESDLAAVDGLGLLDMTTNMAAEKTLTQIILPHAESGTNIKGYEIHHGRTECGAGLLPMCTDDGRVCGATTSEGRVWGTYLHGLFDCDQFRRWFINRLRGRRGLPTIDQVVAVYDIDPALDRLANIMRNNLDVSRIYDLLQI